MVAPAAPRRFDVYLVSPDPADGSELQKPRPCAVVSPDEMNRHIRTVIVAPLTAPGRAYPTRVACLFRRKAGRIVLDQLRAVDTQRLVKKVGMLDPGAQGEVLRVLAEMFAP